MEALSGKRYEHIHVGLTEAIPGFRHFRKEPPFCPPPPPPDSVQEHVLARRHFYLRLSTGIIDPYCFNRP